MDRHLSGKNAYTPISNTRYYIGVILFYLLHLNLKATLFLRHTFIKKYPYYKILKDFHNAYFSQMCKEIKEHKGMCVGKRHVRHEN